MDFDYGLPTTDYGLRYKTRTKHYGLGIKYGLRYKTRTKHYGLGIKHEGRYNIPISYRVCAPDVIKFSNPKQKSP